MNSYSRGREAIKDIGLLDRYGGVLVHDCWSPYFCYDKITHVIFPQKSGQFFINPERVTVRSYNGKSKRQVTGLSHDSDPKVLAEGGELFETNSKPFSWPGF